MKGQRPIPTKVEFDEVVSNEIRNRRPAESVGAAGALAFLLMVVFGVEDVRVLAAVGTLVGLLPAFVTMIVAAGGVHGTAKLFWRGRSK